MFDWISFFDKYRIEYTAKGHTKNNVGICCPFCGETNNAKKYMGVSLVGKGWSCWKFQKLHAGVSPYRLIIALTGCSYSEAVRLVQDDDAVGYKTTDSDFMADFTNLMGETRKPAVQYIPPPLAVLPEFRFIDIHPLDKRLVYPYLFERGYDTQDKILILSERFDLMFAYSGPFAYRIIIPIYMSRELITWTGRTIADNDDLRYKTLSTDPEKAAKQSLPVAKLNIKDTLFDYDNLIKGGDTLVVTEGPFDAMRITFNGERDGILGTCLYNKTLAPIQRELLFDVVTKFKSRYILFDANAELDSFMTFPDDLLKQFKTLYLPVGYKDPAELDTTGFKLLFRNAR